MLPSSVYSFPNTSIIPVVQFHQLPVWSAGAREPPLPVANQDFFPKPLYLNRHLHSRGQSHSPLCRTVHIPVPWIGITFEQLLLTHYMPEDFYEPHDLPNFPKTQYYPLYCLPQNIWHKHSP